MKESEAALVVSNQTKTIRQKQIVNQWIELGYSGTVVAVTGFGKTRVGIEAIKKSSSINPNLTTQVVVPTQVLKQQWEEELADIPNMGIVKVTIINTAYKELNSVYDLLILDEIHRYASEEFSKIFDACSYHQILGLTATLERADGKHDMLENKAPIFHEVGIEECKTNGWVSDFITFNLGVSLTAAEREEYDRNNLIFKNAAMDLGGTSKAFGIAMYLIQNPKIQGPKKIAAWNYYRAMSKRKAVVNNSLAKVDAAADLIERFPERKVLVFGETIKQADALSNKLGNICLPFYATLSPKAKLLALDSFKNGTNGIRVISSVKALSQGLNVPDCSLGISMSGNSRKLEDIQRKGRIIRAVPDKFAIYVNIYAKDTQDERWVFERTKGQKIKWITNPSQVSWFVQK